MSSSPPTKPPRGVKQGKETSGLLMSVIRTLSASETNEQREKERAKLEKEYKKSDARLDELVAAHANEIMDVMQKFTQVNNALTSWGQHGDSAVARLTACRSLLQLRRDDLKRLWALARTHHYALNMLTDISSVVASSRSARSLHGGGVLRAAHNLRAAAATAAALAHVHALHATRLQIQAKKQELVDIIVRRISEAVYREPAALTRHMSAHRKTALLLSELTKSEELTDAFLQDITPEFEASLADDDVTFETTVMICLEALGVLEQLKEATEKFKVQIQNELLEIIDIVSKRIMETTDFDTEIEQDADIPEAEGVSETGRPLARLVACLADEFRACGARNKRLLQLWRAALQKHGVSDSSLHTEQHYWSAVQQVLQLLLTEYLDIESVNLAAQRASVAVEAAPTLKITDYFAKKRPQRRRAKLFTLTSPPPAAPPLCARARVCPAHPALLYAVLPTLHQLCNTINNGGECSLRAFISDYIRSGEATRLASEARKRIEQATTSWRERTHTNNKDKRVVFSCVVSSWGAVQACARAARRCAGCGGQDALTAVSGALAALAAAASAALNTVAPHATTGGPGPICRAAKWLADDDIVRFLQSLPNWRAVNSSSPIEDIQSMDQAYEREAEILGSSLGDGPPTASEIVADVNALADIAVYIESMAWISASTRSLPALVGGAGGVRVTDRFAADIAAAADIFDDLANKCLLFLHLETRIQCFYYLGVSEVGAGEGGGGLVPAIRAVTEHVATILAPNRRNYVVWGLGEMMSAAVIWAWRGAGGAGGAGRLAALRHCAAALALPPKSLHRAHAYMKLLGSSPQEIIQSIKEKGAQFSELEYLNAFKIISERLHLSEADMKPHLKQLSIALEQVGVTV